MQLLVATTNADKLAEITSVLDGLPVDILTLAGFPDLTEHLEIAATFADNARDKALHYAAATGLLTVAEDSGLEIDGLDGAPGVYSARFNGDTYAERFRLIHQQLAARSIRNSPARFVCVLMLVRMSDVLFEARGMVEGTIASGPRGDAGFGYDPIFYYPPYGRTLAEVSQEEKAAVSHRGQAFRKLREFLERQIGERARGARYA